MRAFLEKINREWLDDFVYLSKQPLIDLDIEVISFDTVLHKDYSDFSSHMPNKNDIIIGSVDACEYFFNLCGVEVPKYVGYPSELESYLHREIHTILFSELYHRKTPFFIKPKNKIKLFTGSLIENDKLRKTFIKLYPLLPSEEILCSEPINFITEYRCFVYKNELQGIKHYFGDFKIFPNMSTINKMITDYTKSNISYSLDVGVVEINGNLETVLVEVNDTWGLGSYGFDPKKYVRMVIDRFQEIFKQHRN